MVRKRSRMESVVPLAAVTSRPSDRAQAVIMMRSALTTIGFGVAQLWRAVAAYLLA